MNTPEVAVGSRVRFQLAGLPLEGQILQDRGPIGRGNRHLYLVRYEVGKGNWYSTELPADEIDDVVSRNRINARRKRAVDYIIPIQAVEAHSLFARQAHAESLARFLRDHNVPFTEDRDAIPGEVNFLIDKLTPWEVFVSLLNEWKEKYSEE